MSSGTESINLMIAKVRALKGFAEATAREAGPLIEAQVKAAASAGTDISGKAWASKKDGSRALPDIAKDLSVKVMGTIIQVILVGGGFWHQRALGSATRPQRQILPDTGNGIPLAITNSVTKAAERAFRRMTGG